ncbi:MAG: DUF192 domain-containing protein [Brevinema sp.]
MKTSLMIAFLFLSQQYHIELAITPTEKATGLMFRKEWKDTSQGMLFINEKPQQVSFWMKNTYLNMTIFYLDEDLNILETYRPQPLCTNGMISKSLRVKYILEINPILEKNITSHWQEFKKLLKQELDKNDTEIKSFLISSAIVPKFVFCV